MLNDYAKPVSELEMLGIDTKEIAMANIVFVPLPEFGHLNPTFKLARSLMKNGHCIYYLGIPDREKYINHQGFKFISIFSQACPKGWLYKDAAPVIDNLGRMLLQIGQTYAGDVLNEIREAIKKCGADLLLIDLMLRDLVMVGDNLGIPCALYSTSLIEGYLKFIRSDYDPADNLPVLILCPKELDIPHSNRRSGRYYVEACVDPERKDLDPFPWDKVDDTKRLIYCSLGSQCHQYRQSRSFFRTTIDAMRGNPEWQLILTIGPCLNIADFQPSPENVVIVNWAPQLEILKRSSLMMNNAALGSVKECIFLGVPMIVFPVMWDQPANAERVVYHGLRVRGDINSVSVDQIRNLVDSLDNPMFKRRIDSISKIFHQIEESEISVKIIDGILDGTSGFFPSPDTKKSGLSRSK